MIVFRYHWVRGIYIKWCTAELKLMYTWFEYWLWTCYIEYISTPAGEGRDTKLASLPVNVYLVRVMVVNMMYRIHFDAGEARALFNLIFLPVNVYLVCVPFVNLKTSAKHRYSSNRYRNQNKMSEAPRFKSILWLFKLFFVFGGALAFLYLLHIYFFQVVMGYWMTEPWHWIHASST